jgi:hypothetical protein
VAAWLKTFRPTELLPVGGDVHLAFMVRRRLPPGYQSSRSTGRVAVNRRVGDRFRCPGCQGTTSWHIHGPDMVAASL